MTPRCLHCNKIERNHYWSPTKNFKWCGGRRKDTVYEPMSPLRQIARNVYSFGALIGGILLLLFIDMLISGAIHYLFCCETVR